MCDFCHTAEASLELANNNGQKVYENKHKEIYMQLYDLA